MRREKMRGTQGGTGDNTVECNLEEMPINTSTVHSRNAFKPGKGKPRGRKAKARGDKTKKNKKDKKKDKKKGRRDRW